MTNKVLNLKGASASSHFQEQERQFVHAVQPSWKLTVYLLRTFRHVLGHIIFISTLQSGTQNMDAPSSLQAMQIFKLARSHCLIPTTCLHNANIRCCPPTWIVHSSSAESSRHVPTKSKARHKEHSCRPCKKCAHVYNKFKQVSFEQKIETNVLVDACITNIKLGALCNRQNGHMRQEQFVTLVRLPTGSKPRQGEHSRPRRGGTQSTCVPSTTLCRVCCLFKRPADHVSGVVSQQHRYSNASGMQARAWHRPPR